MWRTSILVEEWKIWRRNENYLFFLYHFHWSLTICRYIISRLINMSGKWIISITISFLVFSLSFVIEKLSHETDDCSSTMTKLTKELRNIFICSPVHVNTTWIRHFWFIRLLCKIRFSTVVTKEISRFPIGHAIEKILK